MKFDTKSIFIPRTGGCGVLKKDLELDGNLSEDLPDIARLISVDAKIGKTSIKDENGKAEVVCGVVFGILYESDYHSKASYTTAGTTFTQKTDVECGKEYYPDADVKCAFLSCKLLGPRRFVIRAGMATRLECDTVGEFRTVDTDSSKVDSYFKSEKVPVTSPCRTYADERHFEGTANAAFPVSSVISVSADVTACEYAASDGRLSVKAPVRVKALCEGENGEYFALSTEIKTLTTAEDADIDENKIFRVSLDASSPSASVESDDYGEQKILRFSVDLLMSAVCYETVTEEIASDVFCADRGSECTAENVRIENIGTMREKRFDVEKTFDTEKSDITRIIDTSVSFRVTDVAQSNGNASVKGVYTANLLTESENGLNEMTFDGEFSETVPISENENVSHVSVTASEAAASLFGGSVTVRASAAIRFFPLSAYSIPAITSVTASDTAERRDDGKIRFYYPSEDETSWDIAKEYRVDPKKLEDNNKNAFGSDGKLNDGVYFVVID